MSDPQKYLVVFEHTDGSNYGAWLPDLPGVIAAANTRKECERLIREAIKLHLAGMREDIQPGWLVIGGSSGRREPTLGRAPADA